MLTKNGRQKDEWSQDYDRFIAGGMSHKESIRWANARDHERAGVPLNPVSAAELISHTTRPEVQAAVSVHGTGRY